MMAQAPAWSWPVKDVGIGQRQRAAVFFDDLLDDGQAKAGALVACRHVGFEQARAVFRQADAVVRDGDRYSCSSSQDMRSWISGR